MWLKKDIKTMCDQITTFWLHQRPLNDSLSGDNEARKRVEEALARSRQDIVLAGLRGMRVMLSQRYTKDCETVGHAIIMPEIWGGEQSDGQRTMIERFKKLGRENFQAARKMEELVVRVVKEGLPPEVDSFSPFIV